MSQKAASKPRSDEQLFLIAAISIALVLGAGLCCLLFALKHHEQQAAGTGDAASGVIPPDHPRQLMDFSLTDRTGRTVTRTELAGKFLVVDFLFTGCSLTCPAVNRCMAQIQELTTNQPDVRLVSLSVDPRDDTPDVLAAYGQRFGADTNRWFLLTGDKDVLYDLIGTSFLAQAPDDPFNYMPGNFAHTERIAVVDPDGRVRAYFDGLRADTARNVAAEISRLRK
jgi:cytochrome oxidase Cu insertion factor (SCO1/SenC/PrrC family)